LIGYLGDSGEQVANPKTALTSLTELPGTAEPYSIGIGLRANRNRRFPNFFSLMFGQHRLGIERVNVAWASIHEAKDDVLGFRSCRGHAIRLSKPGKSEPSKTCRRGFQQGTSEESLLR
jgi:hypothetical protein